MSMPTTRDQDYGWLLLAAAEQGAVANRTASLTLDALADGLMGSIPALLADESLGTAEREGVLWAAHFIEEAVRPRLASASRDHADRAAEADRHASLIRAKYRLHEEA